jgi:benzoyl-CoA 2,3-dioxygenase component B
MALRLKLPSPRFRRSIGAWVNQPVDPEGCDALARRVRPAAARMDPVRRGPRIRSLADAAGRRARRMASWIAAPDRGINNLPIEYEYVKLQ